VLLVLLGLLPPPWQLRLAFFIGWPEERPHPPLPLPLPALLGGK